MSKIILQRYKRFIHTLTIHKSYKLSIRKFCICKPEKQFYEEGIRSPYKSLRYGFFLGIISSLISIGISFHLFKDQLLTYIMHEIYDRREEYIRQCYPERIIIIRHGQSNGNVDQTSFEDIPDHDIELTKIGIQQALAAGRRLKAIVKDEPLYMYYSPYKRTEQTMQYIIKGGKFDETDQIKVAIEDVRLIEQKFGNWQKFKEMQVMFMY